MKFTKWRKKCTWQFSLFNNKKILGWNSRKVVVLSCHRTELGCWKNEQNLDHPCLMIQTIVTFYKLDSILGFKKSCLYWSKNYQKILEATFKVPKLIWGPRITCPENFYQQNTPSHPHFLRLFEGCVMPRLKIILRQSWLI